MSIGQGIFLSALLLVVGLFIARDQLPWKKIVKRTAQSFAVLIAVVVASFFAADWYGKRHHVVTNCGDIPLDASTSDALVKKGEPSDLSAFAQGRPRVFQVETRTLTGECASRYENLKTLRFAKSVTPIRMNPAAINSPVIDITMDGKVYHFTGKRVDNEYGVGWVGSGKDARSFTSAGFSADKATGAWFGDLSIDGREFRIFNGFLVEIDKTKLPRLDNDTSSATHQEALRRPVVEHLGKP